MRNARALQWVLTERKRYAMERIITRNGDYLYTKEDLIDFLDAAGIDRYDCDAIKRKFGVRVRESAEIDSIVRYEYEGYM